MPAQQKANSIRSFLTQTSVKKQLEMAVPKHMSVDRLLRVAVTAIRVNPKLLECDQQSLLACVMGCAQLGLEPEPFLGQAYLVPYWNSKKRTYEAQLIPGYRGYLTLARRSGEVQSISAHVVYENDIFEIEYGLDETLRHVPEEDADQRGKPRGAYCVFRYKDGSHSFDFMTTGEIEKIRARSKAKDNGPWTTDWEEMAKKTVIRRHIKLVPLSVEMARAAAAEDVALGGESQLPMFGDDNALDADFSQVDAPTAGDPAEFDEILKQKRFPNERKGLIKRFVEATAQAQGVDQDTVKAEAVGQWDSFFSAFQQWEKKQDPAGAEETVTCPIDGEAYPVKSCSDCPEKGQCGEYRRAQNER
jgi:recombination protein RecT